MSLGVSHFEILERTENGWVRLALTGELDLASAPQLRDRLAQLAAKRSAVRLDLSRLRFIDSVGLQVLVTAVKDAQSNSWRLHIDRGTTPQVARMFELVHFDEIIPGYDDEQGADLSRRLRVRLAPPLAD